MYLRMTFQVYFDPFNFWLEMDLSVDKCHYYGDFLQNFLSFNI